MLPIIALKGGRGGKGKLLACPIYKRMNVQTAHDLSALARERERRKAHTALETVRLRVGVSSAILKWFRVSSFESLAFAVHLTCICALLHSRQDTWGNFSLAQLSGRRTRYSPRAASLLGRLGSGAQAPGALDSARYREHFAGSTLQGALYREHFTGSTLQVALYREHVVAIAVTGEFCTTR